jgi:exonuclease 3'-5' domain-containing protein 1
MEEITSSLAEAAITNRVILVDSVEAARAAVEKLKASGGAIALDCEGVNLGRCGKICVIQVSTRDQVFLFDVHGLDGSSDISQALREVLEDASITKIIHDCKMDSDALYHHLEIRLRGIHDTQSWSTFLCTDNKNPRSLNDTLAYWSLPAAELRDSSVYRTNPEFWATRPMTSMMIDWAAGDVSCLFDLFERQLAAATTEQRDECSRLSENNADLMRSKLIERVQIKPDMVGRFVGRGGANICKLREKVPGTTFELNKDRSAPPTVLVYYASADTRDESIALLKPYQ